MKFSFSHLLISSVFIYSTSLLADIERCRSDILPNKEQSQGRNAWAKKCNYINDAQERAANELDMYWTFTSGNQPTNADATCVSGYKLQGLCPTGCFTGTEKLMFNHEYLPIESAHKMGLTSATVLNPNLDREETDIMDFVIGDTTEKIIEFTTAQGRKLKVTLNHPIVNGIGKVVRADSLIVGDFILDEDLKKDKIIHMNIYDFSGKVWNILFVSDIKENNLVLSEGLITGSTRFQNQWADDAYRLSLRKNIRVDNL